MVRWITALLSLPFFWAGQLARMFQMPLSVPLLKGAWWIGGDGEVALLALTTIQRMSSADAARAQGKEWMARRPRPEIAGFVGLLAGQAGDLELACDFLTRGRESGQDRGGMLDMLSVFIAAQSKDPAVVLEVARRLEPRRDLPPVVSKFVHEHLLGMRCWAGG